jgi:hypothetical protein
MRLGFLLTKRGAPGCGSVLVSCAAISCTLTTDLDFVGPDDKTSSDTDSKTHTADAGTHDASNMSSDGSLTSATPDTTSTQSTIEGTSTTTVEDDADVSTPPSDASIGDASPLDASPVDAGLDAESHEPVDADCIVATNLLTESFEGDLSQWATINWQSTNCQHTDVATDIAAHDAHSVRSRIKCASDADHLHFASLRLLNETSQNEPTGLDAPYGFVLSFSAWLSVGYDFDTDTWLDFVRIYGSCDRTDSPFAVGLNDPSRRLSISSRDSSDMPSAAATDAPQFPLTTWAKVEMYVNYTEGSVVVWQDGELITSSRFESDYSNLCQLDFGTMASKAHSDLATFEDDVRLSKLEAPLAEMERSPRICRE